MAVTAITVETANAEATHALAARLAASCKPGDCVKLRGDLGAGKTTFARGFIGALCDGAEEIVSPTFTLVQTYPARRGQTVWHFDLYRLKRPEEVRDIGLNDALAEGITLIEWPDIVQDALPSDALTIDIAYGADESARALTFSGEQRAWGERLTAIKQRAA